MSSPRTKEEVFDEPSEWSALTHGIYLGFTTAPWKTPVEPTEEQVLQKPSYYRGGYVLGSILQVVIIVALALLGLDATGISVNVTGV